MEILVRAGPVKVVSIQDRSGFQCDIQYSNRRIPPSENFKPEVIVSWRGDISKLAVGEAKELILELVEYEEG